ncbi:MAG: Shedu anti-phage system protein SduA domain-containing protein [Candidatus Aenigmatarchaeota archaeon]
MVEKKEINKDERKPLLNPKYYKELDSEEVYSDGKRLGKVFGVKNKTNNQKFIRAISESKRPYGWRRNSGFDLFDSFHLDKLTFALRKIAKKLGWKFKDIEIDFKNLKEAIRGQQEMISNLQTANKEARTDYETLLKRYKEQEEKEIINRSSEFCQAIQELKNKIEDVEKRKILESELQDFLYRNSWMFGTEYISSEPQKMRGAKNRFDFYLERFNKTNDIVEIKLLSDKIINQDGSVSAKVIQAVDQLIDYIEKSIGAAHSTTISEEEGIKELRPRGIVIIGKDNSPEAKKKLHKWNYQFSHIQIYTYKDILDKSEALLKHIEEKKVV